MQNKIKKYNGGLISFNELADSFQGWEGYARWADTFELRIIFLITIKLQTQSLQSFHYHQY